MPSDNLNWRVAELERRVTRLEDQELKAELALVKREVKECHTDIRSIESKAVWMQRTMITLLVSLLVAIVAVVLSSGA